MDFQKEYVVQLTEKAAEVVKNACAEEQKSPEEQFLRLCAAPGGCSGYKYKLDFNAPEDVSDNDLSFDSHGIKVVVNQKELYDVIGSVEIDYTDANMVEQGFVFKPISNSLQCGCGQSFTAIKR